MLGGLIAGALKGAAEGYQTYAKGEMENQQKLDYQTKLTQLLEEKERRVAEFQANLGVETKKREVKEVAPLQAAADVNRTRLVGAAETDVLTDREKRKINEIDPLKTASDAKREGALTEARGAAERKNLGAYADDPGARAGVRAKAADQEGPAAKTTAAAASFELAQKKAIADLRKKLSETTDPDQRTLFDQQIRDLSGGSSKSYSDMVTAGDAFRKLADNLRRQLKDDPPDTQEEAEQIRARIRMYEDQAANVLGTTVGKRLGGDAAKPKAGAPAAPAAGAPWTRNWGGQPGNISNNPAP